MTRSMTRWTMAGALALAALGSVAVLGVGSGAAEAAPNVSPFAGSWSGTWTHVGEDVVGTWYDWTISDAGRITGSFHAITNDFSGTVVGHVSDDGTIQFIGHAPKIAFPHKGTAVLEGDNKIAISATGTWSGAFSVVGTLERD